MDFGRAVSFVRQDPNWLVKVLLGSVLSVVPILNFVTLGYMLDVIRNVSQGRETPLPDWGEDFGGKFVRGFMYLVIAFIYTLPILVIYLVFIGITLAAASGADSDAAGAGVGILGCIMVPIIILGAIILGMMAQIAGVRYALTQDFGAAMRFGEVWAEFRNNLGTWGMLILYSIIVQVAVSLVASVTCGLGFLLSFYGTIVLGFLVAQAHRQSSGSFVTEPARY